MSHPRPAFRGLTRLIKALVQNGWRAPGEILVTSILLYVQRHALLTTLKGP